MARRATSKNYIPYPGILYKNQKSITKIEYTREAQMSIEEFETQSIWRPFNQIDYYNAQAAFENMVELGIMTADEKTRKLRILKEATHE